MSPQQVRFQSLRPMLRTKDLLGTIRFYTDFLGVTCDGLSEADGWANLRRDSVELMVAAPNAHMSFDAPAFTGSLYFNVDDAVLVWTAVKDRAMCVIRWKTSITGCGNSRSTTTTDTCFSSDRRSDRTSKDSRHGIRARPLSPVTAKHQTHLRTVIELGARLTSSSKFP